MDALFQHEAFLRAIFDAPDDDTPRLVYADFLDENGNDDRAELIRVQCEQVRACDPDRAAALEERAAELVARVRPAATSVTVFDGWPFSRGFATTPCILLRSSELADPISLRSRAVRDYPEWFGQRELMVDPDRPLTPDEVTLLLDLPFTRQVTDWDLAGQVEEVTTDVGSVSGLIDLEVRHTITGRGVEALARHRGARRIETLLLTNNNLDNDAARALVKSPYLDNLKRLDLLEGNRLRGRVWQQVIERFGEHVVG
jgi:uncharacterized protein (TIGR02996 family)